MYISAFLISTFGIFLVWFISPEAHIAAIDPACEYSTSATNGVGMGNSDMDSGHVFAVSRFLASFNMDFAILFFDRSSSSLIFSGKV